MSQESLLEHLFGPVQVPPWDADKMYVLWERGRTGALTTAEWDNYARYCMHVVAKRFAFHRFMNRLPEVGLLPEDVAAEVLAHLVAQTPRFRVDGPSHTKVMLRQLFTAVFRFVTTKVRSSAPGKRPVAWSVVCVTNDKNNDIDLAGPNLGFDVPIERVQEMLDEVAPALFAGLGCTTIQAEILYRRLVRRMLRRDIEPYLNLPRRLRQAFGQPAYNLVVARFRRAGDVVIGDLALLPG